MESGKETLVEPESESSCQTRATRDVTARGQQYMHFLEIELHRMQAGDRLCDKKPGGCKQLQRFYARGEDET